MIEEKFIERGAGEIDDSLAVGDVETRDNRTRE
jgi:hypothetical protein